MMPTPVLAGEAAREIVVVLHRWCWFVFCRQHDSDFIAAAAEHLLACGRWRLPEVRA